MEVAKKQLSDRTKELHGDRFIAMIEEGEHTLSNSDRLLFQRQAKLELEGLFQCLQPSGIFRADWYASAAGCSENSTWQTIACCRYLAVNSGFVQAIEIADALLAHVGAGLGGGGQPGQRQEKAPAEGSCGPDHSRPSMMSLKKSAPMGPVTLRTTVPPESMKNVSGAP